jgi:two-component system cell cycle sensor histidine kinase/response regulator CckA
MVGRPGGGKRGGRGAQPGLPSHSQTACCAGVSSSKEPTTDLGLPLGASARLLLESQQVARIGSYDLDIARGTWRCSAMLEAIFGIGPDHPHTVAGWLAVIHPDDRGQLAGYLESIIAGRRHFDREYRVIPADGRGVRWVHGLGRLEYDAGGNPARMLGTIQDITERHQVLETLRTSERRFRALFDSAADALFLHDLEGRFVDVNRAASASLGYTRDELLALSVPDVVIGFPPGDFTPLWQRIVGEGTLTVTTAHLRKDGSSFPVEVCLSPFAFGDEPLVLAAARDCSERRLAEDALREQRQTISAIVETSQDWIWAIDLAGRHTFSNPAVERILGIAPAEFQGRGMELMHPDDRRLIEERWAGWVAAKQGWSNLVLRWRHRDGSWRQLESTAVPILGRDGGLLGFRGVDRDVSERLRLEERLRHAEKMEAIGQLAGGVAHDFNNQLAGILGFAELIEQRVAEPAVRRHARCIITAAQRSADLTRELLAFARKGQYLHVAVDLHQVVAETVAILTRSIDRRIDLRQRLDARPSLVVGDPSQLQNALLNLGLNARDAMESGGVLEFATTVVDDPAGGGRRLRLEVSDTGCGMDAEVQAHLFEPFFTTKPPGKGTGMGLAAMYGTVRNHGGTVTVRSAPGQGTTFTLLLPLAAAEAAPPAPAAAPVAHAGGRRLLVVDDEPMLRELLAETLRELGHEVVLAEDGLQALARHREAGGAFDLVILDLVMPGLDGRDTFLRLRQADPRARVLIASGYSLAGDARALLDAGAVGFVQKPFQRDELLRQVGLALGAPRPDPHLAPMTFTEHSQSG